MNISTVSQEGLKREFAVTIPAEAITSATDEKLQAYAAQVKIAGFRPGKVPLSVVRQRYQAQAQAEVLETLLENGTRAIFDKHGIRPAMRPKVSVSKYEPAQGLEYTVSMEIMPTIPDISLQDITLQKPDIAVEDAHVEEGLEVMAKRHERFKESDKAAAEGDRLTIDFEGSTGGVPFEGGKAENFPLVLGSGSFIPGFEDQLIGLKAGEEKTITVTFPENYGQKTLAGQEAQFAIKAHKVETPQTVAIDDELAKDLKHDSLDDLKKDVRSSIEKSFQENARERLKRDLLDHLDKNFTFDLPPSLVEQESAAIAEQMKQEAAAEEEAHNQPGHVHDENCQHDHKKLPEDDKLLEKCKPLAERRVKLGLILAHCGQKNGVQVTEEEVRKAIFQRAISMGGAQAGQILEYFSKNPDAIEAVKAPLFEDKVVDYVIEHATVTTRTISRDDFKKEMEELEKQDMALVDMSS